MNLRGFGEKLGNWELWPFPLRYALITPVWLWYCLRSGSLWFFSSSNPTITFGGFEGEGKREMYELLPPGSYPHTVYLEPEMAWEAILDAIGTNGLEYPFIVKPDVGMKGLLFRKINEEAELKRYHELNPISYLAQSHVAFPLEVSIFYIRHPREARGTITGLIQKDLMQVKGDGRSTVSTLIDLHPLARFRKDELSLKHGQRLNYIPAEEEIFYLTDAANLNRGARFTGHHDLIDSRLTELFDELSHRCQFYYGRYDIKCTSIEDLKEGRNFSILEFNGAGAEPNHIYHAGLGLFQAYGVILRHWKALFEISRYLNKHGHPYWSFQRGRRFLTQARRHLAVLEEFDRKIPV